MRYEAEIFERLGRIEESLKLIIGNSNVKIKKPKPIGLDPSFVDKQYLAILVCSLSSSSKMNFVPNSEILKKIGIYMPSQNSTFISRYLKNNGYTPGVRMIDYKQRRGFYLKFMEPLPTPEEFREAIRLIPS